MSTRAGSFVLGLLVGVGLTIAAIAGFAGIVKYLATGPYSHKDPGGRVWSCAGATGSATILSDKGSVVVTVALVDEAQRVWKVDFRGYDGLTSDLKPTGDGTYPAIAQYLTDLDDGPRRTVAVRPSDATAWCEIALSLR